jgi:hypothetical protein
VRARLVRPFGLLSGFRSAKPRSAYDPTRSAIRARVASAADQSEGGPHAHQGTYRAMTQVEDCVAATRSIQDVRHGRPQLRVDGLHPPRLHIRRTQLALL